MTRFRHHFCTFGFLLSLILTGCQTPAAQTFFRGPFLQGPENDPNTQTLQKLPGESEGLSSTAPPPEKKTEPKPPEKKTGPQFPGKAKLTLTVKAPTRVQHGSRVTFDSVITNTGDGTANDVVIESRYGTVFRFPNRTAESAHQSLGAISPGDTRQLAISLEALKTGNHCVEFTVKTGDREAVWKSVCVDVETPRYQMDAFAPPNRTTGDLVEVTTLLANPSATEMKGVTVTMAFDSEALVPVETTRGVTQESGRLIWKVNKLIAGSGIPMQAEFRCRKPAAKTCVVISVVANDAPSDERLVCFDIADPQGTFEMRMSDTKDLLPVGEETDILTTVKNRSLRSVAGEPLEIIVPDNFRVVSTSVEQDGKPQPVKFEVKEGRVKFEGVPMMSPGDELKYRVRLKATRADRNRVRAELGPSGRPIQTLVEPVTVN